MRYRFRDCELDPRSRELRRASERVHVQPLVFDLLLYLILHRDRVVAKPELLSEIWRGAFVSDAALVSAVRDARQAVGDDGRRQDVLRTVPRIGLRFVAPVEEDAPIDTPARPSPDPSPARRWSCETLIALGVERCTGGDYAHGGRDLFLRAADMARRAGWTDLLARAALGLGELSHGITLGDRVLVEVLEDAIDALGDGDGPGAELRPRLHARLALELGAASERERAERLCHAAVDATRDRGDDSGLAQALLARLMTLSGPRSLDERGDVTDALLDAARASGSDDVAVWGHHFALSNALERADRDALDAAAARAARHDGGLHHTELLAFFEAGRSIWEGRFAVAQRLLDRMLAYDDAAPLVGFRVNALIARGSLAALVGDPLPRGWREELHAAAPPEYADVVLAADAFVSLQSRDLRAARAAYERVVDGERRADMTTLYTVTALAHVGAALRDADRCERLYAALSPYADRVAAGVAMHYLGAVRRALAALARATGRADEVVPHLVAALSVERGMRARPFAALTRRDLARAYADAGDAAAARRELRASLADAEALGMRPPCDDADERPPGASDRTRARGPSAPAASEGSTA